jgi:hypothetical protein
VFTFGKKEIDIIEYTCLSARTLNAKLKQVSTSKYPNKMEISPIKLSVAMGRTILSIDPCNIDLVFQVVSSFFNMQSIIDTKAKNLRVADSTMGKFRDFSLSGRVGELAQAINYIFVQEVLKKPLVVDFEGFLIREGYIKKCPYIGKSPDFISGSIGSNKITLIESKGACPDIERLQLKTKLREGLEQCDEAQQYFTVNKLPVNVQNSFASGVWFSKSSKWNTAIHFSDPDYNDLDYLLDPMQLFRYHYASWFALLGYYRQAIELVSNENVSIEEPDEIIEIGDEKFYILDVSDYYPYYMGYELIMIFSGVYRSRLRFGISQKIWNILKNHNGINIEKEEYYFEAISNEDYELFADGTIIFLN